MHDLLIKQIPNKFSDFIRSEIICLCRVHLRNSETLRQSYKSRIIQILNYNDIQYRILSYTFYVEFRFTPKK